MLTLYVSYVLARVNFYVKMFAEDDFAEASGERLYTTRFSDKEWIEIFEILPPDEGRFFFEPWGLIYENQVGERLGVIFVEMLVMHMNKDEADVLVDYIKKN